MHYASPYSSCKALSQVGRMAGKSGSAPIYSVTVVARTTKAVNYQYRSGPTRIDFRGTVLLPAGKGDATVESQRGRTDIQASLENSYTAARSRRYASPCGRSLQRELRTTSEK